MRTKLPFFVVGLTLAVVAVAQTERTGNRLKSIVEVTAKALYTYDTNLFQTQDERSDDYLTAFLGLELSVERNGLDIGIGGEVRDKHYDTYDNQDDTEYDLTTHAIFGANTLKLGLYGNFLHDISPVDATNVSRVESDTNSGWATLTIVPSDIFGIELTGGTEDKYYEGFDALEYFKSHGTLRVYTMVSDKTKMGLSYYIAEIDYDADVRYDVVITRLTGFVDHDITGKLISHVEVGTEAADYDTDTGIITDKDDASDELYLALSLNYMATGKVEVYAGLNRQLEQSSAANSNFYTEQVTKAGMIFKPNEKIAVDVAGIYTDVVENGTFDSVTIGGIATVNYMISDSFSMEASYQFTDRDSESPIGDYKREISTIGLVVTW